MHAVPGFTRWVATTHQQLEYDPAPDRQADGVLADLNEWRLLYEASDDPQSHAVGRITWYGLDSWSGFEPEFGAGRYFGLAWRNGYVATGMDTPAGKGVGEIFAHEVAHDAPFGRLHASDQCTNWPITDAGNGCDINYPWANGCIDEYGFDPVTMKVVRPNGASPCMMDLMSYGNKKMWISTYTYKALYTAAANLVVPPRSAQATQATPVADPPYVVLLASGLITSDGQVKGAAILRDAHSARAGTWTRYRRIQPGPRRCIRSAAARAPLRPEHNDWAGRRPGTPGDLQSHRAVAPRYRTHRAAKGRSDNRGAPGERQHAASDPTQTSGRRDLDWTTRGHVGRNRCG